MLWQFPWQPAGSCVSPNACSRGGRMGGGLYPLPAVTWSPWRHDTTAAGRVYACRLDGETRYSLPLPPALKVIHVDIDHLLLLHLLQRRRLNALLCLSLSSSHGISICFCSSPTADLHAGLFIVDSRRLRPPSLPDDARGGLCPCLPYSFDALMKQYAGR